MVVVGVEEDVEGGNEEDVGKVEMDLVFGFEFGLDFGLGSEAFRCECAERGGIFDGEMRVTLMWCRVRKGMKREARSD